MTRAVVRYRSGSTRVRTRGGAALSLQSLSQTEGPWGLFMSQCPVHLQGTSVPSGGRWTPSSWPAARRGPVAGFPVARCAG